MALPTGASMNEAPIMEYRFKITYSIFQSFKMIHFDCISVSTRASARHARPRRPCIQVDTQHFSAECLHRNPMRRKFYKLLELSFYRIHSSDFSCINSQFPFCVAPFFCNPQTSLVTMWRTSSDNGPYFSADGRPYFMVNGQPVWASSGQINPGSVSSSRGIAPSVASAYQSASVPLFSSSYPPATPPSSMKTRFTSGYPTTRFAAGESQGSAPASGHQTLDPYRSAIDPAQNRTGPPLNSPFMKQYNDYKDCDFAAEAAEDQYKSYLKSAGKVSTKMKQNSPGVYDGEPPQTKDWHQSAAQYASLARDKYDE